jgi:hypothetical protein
MRARAYWVVALLLFAVAPAGAEPKPTKVEIKAFRDQLLVFQDPQGGTYAVLPATGSTDARVFYGSGKSLYEQYVIGRSTNGDAWSIDTWAPRLKEIRPGSIMRKEDGSYVRWCADEEPTVTITPVTGDKAKAVLDKVTLMTPALTRSPYLLARDDGGVYYYVDRLTKQYGAKGYRVFVGKKGAMKELPLTDVAIDSGGDVFATKTGDLRFVRTEDEGKTTMSWVRGEKKTTLIKLDNDVNSPLIFKSLGVYAFTGTLCENL